VPAPVLSICIPSYNREPLVLEQLQLLDAPRFLPFDFEVIVVDNASSSSAYESVRDFVPTHYALRYRRLDQTITAFANVSGSLRRATGTFCAYLADDDRLVPDALADVVAVMQSEPNVLATYAGWEYVDLVENRVLYPGAQLEDTIFDATSAALPLAGVVARQITPEIGVYRTDALARSLLPSRLFYWSFILIARQLQLGSVRLSARGFYQYVWRRHGEPYPRPTLSRHLPLEHWDAMNRGLDLWSRYLPPAALGAPESPALRVAKRAYLELAFAAATTGGRHLEAFDIGLYLQTFGDNRLTLGDEVLKDLLALAVLEALYEVYQTVPELSGLCLHGFDDDNYATLATILTGFTSGRKLAVRAAGAVAPPALPDHLVLTHREFQRARFVAQGCAPGLVYSWESLNRVFSF
jgi:glycosyltransferase involved in cell wall biosynthesis